jgi:hypothetical protein
VPTPTTTSSLKLTSAVVFAAALCGGPRAATRAAENTRAPTARSPEKLPQWKSLFNGRNLSGWINVNTAKDTWSVRKGVLVSTGKPTGVMRTEKKYENFLLHIEWRHMEAGGNSGVFLWSDGTVPADKVLPRGLEVQMLELDWINLHKDKDGNPAIASYVEGELFGANGLTTVPDRPRTPGLNRSRPIEQRCRGKGEWNTYDVVAIDGVVKLAVNGKVVNGISKSSIKKGYLNLESEGSEIHFRNIQILELPPGMSTPEETAPIVEAR